MNRKYVLTATMISVVLLTVAFIPLSGQQSGSYDPWIDYNEDGTVDVNDLSTLGQAYASSGDPAKNVTVTNWPVSPPTTVWFSYSLTPNDWIYSALYNASGFGHLHVLTCGENLSVTETLTVKIFSPLWNPSHTAYNSVEVYQVDLTSLSYSAAITIPVPSEEFFFYVYASSSTYDNINLSFYLTWA